MNKDNLQIIINDLTKVITNSDNKKIYMSIELNEKGYEIKYYYKKKYLTNICH